MIDFYGKKEPNATEEHVEGIGQGTNNNESKEQLRKNDIETKINENGTNEDKENKDVWGGDVPVYKDDEHRQLNAEHSDKKRSAMLATFASISSFICNIGAFV